MSALAELKAGVIYASIEIDAPPDAVWDALTDRAQLASWWGSPDTYRTSNWELMLEPGGKWSCDATTIDGSRSSKVYGEYREVDKPRLLVYTWQASWDNFAETLIRLELLPTPSGTRVTIRHSGFAEGSASGTSHAEGWKRVLGWLAGHAALR